MLFFKVQTMRANDIVINGEQVDATTPIKLYLDTSIWEDNINLYDLYIHVERITYFNNKFYTIEPVNQFGVDTRSELYSFGPFDSSYNVEGAIYNDMANYADVSLCVYKDELYVFGNQSMYKYNAQNKTLTFVSNLPTESPYYNIFTIEYKDSIYLIDYNKVYVWDGSSWSSSIPDIPEDWAYDNGCVYKGNLYVNYQNKTYIWDGSTWILEDTIHVFEYDPEYSYYDQHGIFLWNGQLMNYGHIKKNNEYYFVIFRLEDDVYHIFTITDLFVTDRDQGYKVVLFDPSNSGFTQELLVYYDSDVTTKITKSKYINSYYSLKRGND